jgi:uncharacterized membrane protein
MEVLPVRWASAAVALAHIAATRNSYRAGCISGIFFEAGVGVIGGAAARFRLAAQLTRD